MFEGADLRDLKRLEMKPETQVAEQTEGKPKDPPLAPPQDGNFSPDELRAASTAEWDCVWSGGIGS